VTLKAALTAVFPFKWPARAVVVEGAGPFKALRDVTFSASDAIEDPSRVRVLVTRLTATHDDRAEALKLTLGVALGVTFKALHVRFMLAYERVAGVFLMIKLDLGVEGLPPKGVVTVLTVIEVRLDPLPMKLAMTLATLW